MDAFSLKNLINEFSGSIVLKQRMTIVLVSATEILMFHTPLEIKGNVTIFKESRRAFSITSAFLLSQIDFLR